MAVCGTTETKMTASSAGKCHDYVRTVSPNACRIFDYGQHIKNLFASIGKYLGVVLIILGVAFLWKGYYIYKVARYLFIGSIVWAVLFGLAYNLFPAQNFNMTVFFIMLGVTLLIGAIAGYFLTKCVEQWIFPLACGYIGAAVWVLICGLIKLDGNSKIVLAFALVGFISGVTFGKCRPNMDVYVETFGMSFLGAYLLLFGISSYLGGL